MTASTLTRRGLIAGGLTAAGTALILPGRFGEGMGLAPMREISPVSPPRVALPEQRLALRCIHTGHHCDAVFMRGADFVDEGLAELNQGLRDWRTGDATAMDRDLLRLLVNVREKLEVPARTPFQIISGYRSPRTNAALHERSNGVATKSQHMLGKAVDIALPGVPLDRIRTAARSLDAGGVGFYPKDGFVHLDTGKVRFWGEA